MPFLPLTSNLFDGGARGGLKKKGLGDDQRSPSFDLNGGTEIDTEDGKVLAVAVGILVAAHLHIRHLLLQQGGEDGPGYAFVLHQVLEHDVVNRIGYYHNYINFIN